MSLTMTVFDVGFGDCILVEAGDGVGSLERLLVDGGSEQSFDTVRPYLKDIHHLKYLVATHCHTDHIGGLESIIETVGGIEAVEQFWLPESYRDQSTLEIGMWLRALAMEAEGRSQFANLHDIGDFIAGSTKCDELRRSFDKANKLYYKAAGGPSVDLGPYQIDFLAPGPNVLKLLRELPGTLHAADISNEEKLRTTATVINNQSLVLRVRPNDSRDVGLLLLTGDAEEASMREMCETPEQRALLKLDETRGVLKVPHHGARHSLLGPDGQGEQPELKAVQPLYAVVSVGERKTDDPPHAKTFEAYCGHFGTNSRLYCTNPVLPNCQQAPSCGASLVFEIHQEGPTTVYRRRAGGEPERLNLPVCVWRSTADDRPQGIDSSWGARFGLR